MNTESPVVWVADDDPAIRWVLQKALEQEGLACRGYENAEDVLEHLAQGNRPSVLVTDIRMPGADGLALLAEVQRSCPQLPVIVITAHSDLDSAVSAYQGGAFEYLPKPFDIDQAVELIRRAAAESPIHEPQTPVNGAFPAILGSAPAMQSVFRSIGRLSASSMTVLITGESGTGKELVARALHQHSPRAAGPFIALNTSAIPAELLESELFGHEKGAFTGADRQRIGRFEQADGGTLFLDEIGDMAAGLQTRLLRVLAEGEFFRVGGQKPIRVDTRVVAATNQDLARKVEDGSFREDLFHRLNVMRIEIPPLRERPEDIPVLLSHYLQQAAAELEVPTKILTPEALQLLGTCSWPGNVRQLVNACRRLTVIAPGREIRVADIPAELGGTPGLSGMSPWTIALARWAEQELSSESSQPLLSRALPAMERVLIRTVLAHTDGKRQEAAQLLGWGRNTLTRKIKELGLDDED